MNISDRFQGLFHHPHGTALPGLVLRLHPCFSSKSTSLPVQECLPREHKPKLVGNTFPDALNGSVVPDKGGGHLGEDMTGGRRQLR